MNTLLQAAKAAKPMVAKLTKEEKNRALYALAQAILAEQNAILQANSLDLAAAQGHISPVMLDRLRLNPQRIAAMAEGIRQVAVLPDPVGNILKDYTRSDGLRIQQISAPMGVIAIIYESRPNVTADAAALTLKSGSVCILRSGKEAYRSAAAIVHAMHLGLEQVGIPQAAISLVSDTSRESANILMSAQGYVDLLIPRGGAGLIQACVRNATVPCIATGTGICHVYVEKTADLSMALSVVENAKTSRPSVCNAQEVLVVDSAIAEAFLPQLKKRLVDERIEKGLIPVQLRLDALAQQIIPGEVAGETDFDTEFLDYILAIKCVDSTQAAIDHITAHSTGHSEAIITQSEDAKKAFIAGVDSAAVYINASTRFTDGGEFGLGCEMGISTQKLHARGPMGLQELTTAKYIITGNGHIRGG